MLAIMVPAVLPPPFPFKPFMLWAGVFKLKMTRFSRGLYRPRDKFPDRRMDRREIRRREPVSIERHGLKVSIAVGVIVLVKIAFKFYRARRAQPLPADEAQSRRWLKQTQGSGGIRVIERAALLPLTAQLKRNFSAP